ncbi:MAG TPA: hypothetical protein VKB87_01035 [Myxococcaceae bacterium]|nr:hypothetical protein [Myxococcaceae bacterium]
MTNAFERKTKRDAAEVRAEIQRAREQIASSAEALRHEVAVRTDWREWVRRKPALFLMGAFAAGFLIARRLT